MKTLNDISLGDLLPDSISRDETVANTAAAIDPELRALSGCVRLVSVYSRLNELTSPQLDHLAVQFHVAVWNSSWPREKKLAVLRATVETKRRRGTLLAVKEAVGSIVSPFEIVEWWQEEPKSDPFTFKVTIPLDDIGKDLTVAEQEELFDLIDEAKSIRSHGSVTLTRAYEQTLRIGAVCSAATYVRLIGERIPIELGISIPPTVRPTVYVRI